MPLIPLLCGKQILGEFTAGEGIEEFLRIVKPGPEFSDDLIVILRDIWILELDQAASGSQHRLVGQLPGLIRLAAVPCHLGLEDFPFCVREIEIDGRYDFSRALAYAEILQAVFPRI